MRTDRRRCGTARAGPRVSKCARARPRARQQTEKGGGVWGGRGGVQGGAGLVRQSARVRARARRGLGGGKGVRGVC